MPTRDEPVYIRVEKNEHILGTLLSPGTLIPGVLFVHGWGADQNQYLDRARDLAAHGCVCLTFDLRGHAQTQKLYDVVSREESKRDILAASDFLAAQRSVVSVSIAVRRHVAARLFDGSRDVAKRNGARCAFTRNGESSAAAENPTRQIRPISTRISRITTTSPTIPLG